MDFAAYAEQEAVDEQFQQIEAEYEAEIEALRRQIQALEERPEKESELEGIRERLRKNLAEIENG